MDIFPHESNFNMFQSIGNYDYTHGMLWNLCAREISLILIKVKKYQAGIRIQSITISKSFGQAERNKQWLTVMCSFVICSKNTPFYPQQ